LKRSGTLSKLTLCFIALLSGCATIRHTQKTSIDLSTVFTGKAYLPDSTTAKYRIQGKGFSLSGTSHIIRRDTFLEITTNNMFTGPKHIRVNIENTNYTLLDFLGLYIFGENFQREFTVLGDGDDGSVLLTKKSDTLMVYIKNGHVDYAKNRNDDISLFYNKDGKLASLKGTFQGFYFEVSFK